MMNLFSTFDPATSNVNSSVNWISTFLIFLMIPSSFWIIPTRYQSLIKTIYMKLHNEFKMLLSTKTMGFSLMFISFFMFILINNMMGLLPYVFTSSSHLLFTMTLALPLWVSLMIFGWVNSTQHMYALQSFNMSSW